MGCGSSKPRGGFEIATTSFHPKTTFPSFRFAFRSEISGPSRIEEDSADVVKMIRGLATGHSQKSRVGVQNDTDSLFSAAHDESENTS
jgi:hypothetical protein